MVSQSFDVQAFQGRVTTEAFQASKALRVKVPIHHVLLFNEESKYKKARIPLPGINEDDWHRFHLEVVIV
jgi:hypothetical protein